RQRLEFFFERVDLVHPRLIAADPPIVGGTEQLAGDGADHPWKLLTLVRRLYHAVTAGFASGTPEYGTFRANPTRMRRRKRTAIHRERYEGVGMLSIGGLFSR